MHRPRQPGEIGMHVPEPAPKGGGEPGVQAIVVEDADERVVEREKSDGQDCGRRGDSCFYFVGERQPGEPPGTNMLYLRI